MKKLFFITIVALGTLCACTTTETKETTSVDYSNLTVDTVLEKSAEARQNIQTYKTAAKTASDSSSSSSISSAAKEKVSTVKQQVKDEANAWKDTLKN